MEKTKPTVVEETETQRYEEVKEVVSSAILYGMLDGTVTFCRSNAVETNYECVKDYRNGR